MGWLDDIRHDLRHGHTHRHHHHRGRLERRIIDLERELAAARATEHADAGHIETQLAEMSSLLSQLVVGMSATGFDLRQIDLEGALMIDPTKDGVALGTTGYFSASTLPLASKLKLGTAPSFTTGDTSVTLSASPDGDPFKVAAAVALTETLTSFGITVSGTSLDGTAISSNFSIPVLPAGTTGGVPATAFDLIQIPNPAAPPPPPPPPPPVTPVASPASVSLAVGATQPLSVTETSGDVTASSTYASDNNAVATVDTTGVITGVSAGSANVTVTDAQGNSTVVPVTVA